MPINVLSEALASRIAAGEVVERPASVVKELVENSLDAGATRIEIDVKGGGAQSIRVTDNGTGIAADEVVLAFERFATSKIDESSDLTGISTLGFRGEALPSIASVARVEAITRIEGENAGAKCVVEYGDRPVLEPAGAPRGTTITVSGLFRNVPARLKFMSSPAAEMSRIQQLVANLALIYPSVAFRLTADGKQRLATPGDGMATSAVTAVYGRSVAESMLRIDPESDAAFSVAGLVSAPTANRSSRAYVTVAVNGRWVQSRRIVFAIEQAYHGFLPERRFPIAVVNVVAPPEDVDVNVHPAKAEVRFLREDLIFSMVQRGVRHAISEGAAVKNYAPLRTDSSRTATAGAGVTPDSSQWAPAWPSHDSSAGVIAPLQPLLPGTASVTVEPHHAQTHREVLPVLRVIGQARETYIIAEGPDGIYLVDQHAAHERVLYEQIRQRARVNAAENQQLLDPVILELPPRHSGIVDQHAADLEAAGFVVEPFGEGAVLVRAAPSMLVGSRGPSISDALLQILDEVSEGGRADSWQDRLLYTLACHSAVRAGKLMTIDESRELIRLLEQAEQPRTCPHGRPTMIHLAGGELEREFGRR